jgi:Domain of Unknown Function (DUF1259)
MAHVVRRTLASLAVVAGAVLALAVAAPASHHNKMAVDWTPVGQALGIPGSVQSGGVYRIDIPRTDLKVTLQYPAPQHGHSPRGTVALKPSFALGGYLVFLSTGSGMQAMMMGDLVLTESEIEPVMLKLEQGGVDVAAIHNHLLWEKPTVMYMHVMVTGDAVQLATAVHDALALTHTPLTPQTANPADQKVDLDTAALDQAIGVTGKVSGGVYKFSIAPKYTITSMGMTIPPSMGMSTGLAFQPLGKGRAAVTGDFVLLGKQINPVIRALRTNGISVTALHSHMLDATPTVFFMHFYATGDALALAHGLRAGLDAITANP